MRQDNINLSDAPKIDLKEKHLHKSQNFADSNKKANFSLEENNEKSHTKM